MPRSRKAERPEQSEPESDNLKTPLPKRKLSADSAASSVGSCPDAPKKKVRFEPLDTDYVITEEVGKPSRRCTEKYPAKVLELTDSQLLEAAEAAEKQHSATGGVESVETKDINRPLEVLNRQMNLYMPELKTDKGQSLISVVLKPLTGTNKKYININYNGRPQTFLIGTGERLWKFSAMTPFAQTRFVDDLPFGHARNRFNDPNSEFCNVPSRRVKLPASCLTFQLTNERISSNDSSNLAMDKFLDWLEDCNQVIFEQTVANLSTLFPTIYKQLQAQLEKEGLEPTRAKIHERLKVNWVGLNKNDKKSLLLRYTDCNIRLFKFAQEAEKEQLALPDFESVSGEPEITQMLKKSLTEKDDSGMVNPKIDTDLNFYRCLTDQERSGHPNGSPFAKMSYAEIKEKFAGKRSIVSVIMQFTLKTNETKIRLHNEPKGVLYLGPAGRYETEPVLQDTSQISFG